MIDGLPTLASGAHKPQDGEACVMEYVALLAGEAWTDRPSCTHPVLAAAARAVNDRLPDSERYRLVPLIGRLFGTARPVDPVEDRALSAALARWCAASAAAAASYAASYAAATAAAAASYAVTAYAAYAAYAASYAYAASAASADASADAASAAAASASAASASASAYGVEFLDHLIDEYDRLTGRTTHREVTPTELADLARQVTGSPA